MHRWCNRVQVIAKLVEVVHRLVNIAAGQRVIDGIYHIQNVNVYDSRLKQWMVKFMALQRGISKAICAGNITPKACFIASLGRTRLFQQVIAT